MQEAHSEDAWPLTLNHDAPQSHQDPLERYDAARAFLARYPHFAAVVKENLYVDNEQDSFALVNGLWPERYLLLEGQKVCWASDLSFETRFTDLPRALRDAADFTWRRDGVKSNALREQ